MEELRPLDIEQLRVVAEHARWLAQVATREEMISYGFLPETADAVCLARECFRADWWHRGA